MYLTLFEIQVDSTLPIKTQDLIIVNDQKKFLYEGHLDKQIPNESQTEQWLKHCDNDTKNEDNSL